MDRRALLACIAGSLLAMSLFSAETYAQSTPTSRPNPPAEICVNGKCMKPATPSSPTSGSIKWNPGNYMASDTILYAGNTLATVQSEMDDIRGFDNILGYRVFITWGALEPSEGNYDFDVLDAILNRLKTQYTKPKHMVVVVLPGPFGSSMPSGGSGRVIPTYLQTDATYGASPVTQSYGWWGQQSGGVSTGPYVAALYRPAVMNRMIALVQAMGAHYDNDPYFEGLMFQEDAWMVSSWSVAPDYSEAAFISQLERLLTASTAAFPHTNVIMENTWAGDPTTTQNFELWMVNNRIAPGTADTVGQSAFNMGYSAGGLNWGLQAYLGVVSSGSKYSGGDLRPRSRAMLDVEGYDISGNYYADWGAPAGYRPSDIITALNSTYEASHAFWTHFSGSEGVLGGGTVQSAAPWATWSSLAPVINAAPLTHTGYPANYP